LMNIYWFFDLPQMAAWNLLNPALLETETFREMMFVASRIIQSVSGRKNGQMPI